MHSIGERLQEARKRLGVSVREAAEATKIRGEYLQGFEADQFEINMPDIYVRGFLRSYARYLKIPADQIMTDYNAAQLNTSRGQKKESRDGLGRIEIADRTPAPRPAASTSVPSKPASKPKPKAAAEEDLFTETPPRAPRQTAAGTPATSDPEPEEEAETAEESAPAAPRRRLTAKPRSLTPDKQQTRILDFPSLDREATLKVGIIALSSLLVIAVLVWIVTAVIRSGPAEDPEVPAATAPAGQVVNLIATGDVRVKVTQMEDGRVLFDGPMAAGETRPITRRGGIIITYSHGRNLLLEQNGNRYQMSNEGIGRNTFN
ncbi:MAG: hypothetical protein EA425_13125 [Puniceicoccaceae bacterium]|nr:MAG: hypothetical protein EA425_13125 [Puniceicoccaceae bacterium]